MNKETGKYVLNVSISDNFSDGCRYFDTLEEGCMVMLNANKKSKIPLDLLIVKAKYFPIAKRYLNGEIEEQEAKEQLIDVKMWNIEHAEAIVNRYKFELL